MSVVSGHPDQRRCRPGNHSDFSVFPNFSLGVWQSERVRKTWNEITNPNIAVLCRFETPTLIFPSDKKVSAPKDPKVFTPEDPTESTSGDQEESTP